ncbi:biotin holocarboxylase synthetase [Pseudogymnoascus destructans]|uniref:BPL/LPL catalytic domain-containing protein n=2 Tax=Pseudogymnoascus destructans TaxID=655981 RepID=L8G7N5_PSED2|nr:biotin holocarboxylase synthetase [Pseudogymnoascus destructans]ELR09082.1 hypothetical protein GMDG_03666 [Pseudogymnoascus destructans 20631-21]OAF57974.2 biotin holocarboxylase synthetase [Pseudogymnoascus destructans]
MVTKKMNVLVYSGTGSTDGAVRHALCTLRLLLSPNYAVFPVSDSVIIKEPWTSSCALLVFPGGADLGYCRVLNGEGNDRISQYVRRGGSYLGFCAGGYYGSGRCEFEVGDKKMEVVGKRELSFFPGICRGCAFKGFVYQSEAGACAAELTVETESFAGIDCPKSFKSYYNGGGVFVDAANFKSGGVEVLATYSKDTDVDGGDCGTRARAAAVFCKIGDGCAVLTGPHPEFAAANLDAKSGGLDYAKMIEDLVEGDNLRESFMKACLTKMGLLVAIETSTVLPVLSALHISSLHNVEVSELFDDLKSDITLEEGESFVKGGNDTFLVEKNGSPLSLHSLGVSLPGASSEAKDEAGTDQLRSGQGEKNIDYNKVIKRLVFHDGGWPQNTETPHFNHDMFYSELVDYQDELGSRAEDFGKVIMYGDVVTSTNTLLEKNQKLLSHLPNGFTATATAQVAGRGRGSNVWVSPVGSLIFSTCIRHSLELSAKAPVIFVQYLAAIAIAEGIKTYGKGYEDIPVKLKWPNDIYALDPTKPGNKEYVKIGGILVNSSYSSGNYNLVVGIGINTTNAAPTTSLNALRPQHLPEFTIEKLLARILTKFEDIYIKFCRSGFDKKLEETYYKLWLHSEQIITLEAEGGVRARVLGITRDWGFLRVQELGWEDKPTGKIIELQTDSNSFDFFRGLVKRKV